MLELKPPFKVSQSGVEIELAPSYESSLSDLWAGISMPDLPEETGDGTLVIPGIYWPDSGETIAPDTSAKPSSSSPYIQYAQANPTVKSDGKPSTDDKGGKGKGKDTKGCHE